MLGWPSSQPLRDWSVQCADVDYIDTCSRFRIPGEPYCENHLYYYRTVPKIITLCGSTRYWETFRDVGLDLTMAGIIVLSIGIAAPDSMVLAYPDTQQGKYQKNMLDSLHKDKISMSSQILVLNVAGYIGDSTKSEINHALTFGKKVRWLYQDKVPVEFLIARKL